MKSATSPLLPAMAAMLALAMPALGQQQSQTPASGDAASAPTEVGVIRVETADVPFTLTLPGRAVAYEQTDIRPQVGGQITEILYSPGQRVSRGDLLFRLDAETFEADLAAAEASVEGARAAVGSAEAMVERYSRLQTAVSRVDLSDAQVALVQAQAALRSAEAQRNSARLALSRSSITSPIDGIADVAAVSVGDIVTAGQAAALTTVTRLDPIYVDVTASSVSMMRNRALIDAGELVPEESYETRLILETGQVYSGEGRMVSPGFKVSTSTGTVPIRLEYANTGGMILPGQFLRVEMTIGSTRAILVPQRATERGADGTLTAFVVRDGTAQRVTLTTTGSYRNAWVTTAGIESGAMLILDGLNNLRPGTAVSQVPVTIDAEGVVRDVADGDRPATN